MEFYENVERLLKTQEIPMLNYSRITAVEHGVYLVAWIFKSD